MGNSNNSKNIQWHTGFYCGMKLSLIDYKDILDFTEEFQLTSKPLQIDFVVVKKLQDCEINNDIARLFEKYNIMEYKNPNDSLNMKTFYKAIAYACLYIVLANDKEMCAKDVTISLVRSKKPSKLFRELKKAGFEIEPKYDGVYLVKYGIFSTQIIVTSEVSEQANVWLKSLKNGLSKQEIIDFMQYSQSVSPNDKELVDAVVDVVVKANDKQFCEMKGSDDMSGALLEIFKPELENAEIRGEVKVYYKKLKHSAEEIAEELGMKVEDVEKIIASLS